MYLLCILTCLSHTRASNKDTGVWYLKELSDQMAQVLGVADRYRCVAPPADLIDQLPQVAALKLQEKTHM